MSLRMVLTAVAVLCLAGATLADVPQLINYQGILLDDVGDPVTTTTDVVFTIYGSESGSDDHWSESRSVTPDDLGRFNILLGQGTVLPGTVFESADRWLGVQVGLDPEMVPRQRLTSVAFSYVAERAQTADVSDSTDAITDGAVDFADIGSNDATEGQIMKWDGFDWVVADDEIGVPPDPCGWQNTDNYVHLEAGDDSVGIGTAAPEAKLHIDGTLKVTENAVIGINHIIYDNMSFVSGNDHATAGDYASITGGYNNYVNGQSSTIAGGEDNQISHIWSFIGAGTENHAASTGSLIGAGRGNYARGDYSVIGGGRGNKTYGNYSVIVGGGGPEVYDSNSTPGSWSCVLGGRRNNASGAHSSVLGGEGNDATGTWATTCGGAYNEASSMGSFAAGYNCTASGIYSFALGDEANANHQESFVWCSKEGTTDDASSERDYQYKVSADGGVKLEINSDYDFEFFYSRYGGISYKVLMCSNGANLTSGGTWTNASDRNLKENFTTIEHQEVLDKIAALPITRWNYKNEGEAYEHIGPVAQDFHAAFGVGDDVSISTVDADGVALAAIQGLYQQNKEQQKRIEELEALVRQLLEDKQ